MAKKRYAGNAWAAAGMLRVPGTLKRPVYTQNFEINISDLGSWVSEIHGGMYPRLVRNLIIHPLPFTYRPMQQPNGLFRNDADGFNNKNSNSNNNFDDASSSALLAATVCYLARITGNETCISPSRTYMRSPLRQKPHFRPIFPSPHPSFLQLLVSVSIIRIRAHNRRLALSSSRPSQLRFSFPALPVGNSNCRYRWSGARLDWPSFSVVVVCTVPWAIFSHNAVLPFLVVGWLYSHLCGLFGEVVGTVLRRSFVCNG